MDNIEVYFIFMDNIRRTVLLIQDNVELLFSMDNIRRTVLYYPWIIYRTVLCYDYGKYSTPMYIMENIEHF